jgi:hypothetical protein
MKIVEALKGELNKFFKRNSGKHRWRKINKSLIKTG